jgi:hypothetical protein
METEFKTSDIREAAYLYYLGFLPEFDRRDPRRVILIFKCDGEFIVQRIKCLVERQVRVEPMTFISHLRELKRAILSEAYQPRYHQKKSIDSVIKPNGDTNFQGENNPGRN